MKKILLVLCILVSQIYSINASDLKIEAKGVYLMEYHSGKVLYAQNETEKLYPASMTKMMTMLLVFEQLNEGKLKWDDQVIASDEAISMGGTQIYLKQQEMMSVKDLVYSVLLASANDASVALACHIKGSHEAFVNAMNQKAKQLKLENTHFMNANGLHDDNHYSCAKDMAIIAKALIDEGKEELLKITSTYEYYIRQDQQPFWLVNTNKLLKTYPSVDGLKTGYTSQALSCITATASKSHIRLIAVVMHANNATSRNEEIVKLLDYGFSIMKETLLYDENQIKKKIQINDGNQKFLDISNNEAFYAISDQKIKIKQEHLKVMKEKAPIKKGELVAYQIIKTNDNQILNIPLYANKTIDKQTFMQLLCEQLLILLF